jgi:hypothetical protein
MRTKNEDGAAGDVVDGFDEDGSAAAQLLYHVAVMDDFVVDVDGAAIEFEGKFNDINGSDYAGAKAPGTHADQGFDPGGGG